MLSIQTIMHPTDFSVRSEIAFRLACSLARVHGARLIVQHVVPPPQPVGYGEMVIVPPLSPDYKEQLEDKLRQFKSIDPKLRVDCRLDEGFAADVILRTAQEAEADLIVMGTHGRTGLGRLLMGSVADQILQKASCPVLTVKTPFSDVNSILGKARDLVNA